MRRVHWNKLARQDYFENIDYLLFRWNDKVAQEFIDLVEEVEEILSKGNIDFRKTDISDVRCYVICRQITLFYKITDNDNIELLRFWNNNKNKDKLNL